MDTWSTPRDHNIMALVDTKCFTIYYGNFIRTFNKSTAAKEQKNKNIIFFVHKQSVRCGNRQKMK